ncbi:hypothetical protein [Devosia sp.]|jgi:hypothetical protein|uniref:hypothetical protein n=1 Tax=Devosia sp. TaxID=1871048 RepID=UPI0037BF213B
MAQKPTKTGVSLPALLASLSQESAAGKTTFTTVLADVLALAQQPFTAFQADDKPRLQQMLGARVTDLKADPDLLLERPSLLRTAYTPLYAACAEAKSTGTSILLDGGAGELENLLGFFTDIDLDEDLRVWGLPMLVHVLVQADPEAILAAAMTWRGVRASVPSAQLVLVENLHDRGRIDRLPPTSTARRLYETELAPLVAGASRIVMPAILTDFWQPFEESGTRFLKVMALEAQQGAEMFGMSPGDFKLARGSVTRFFRQMQAQIETVLVLSKTTEAGNA